MNEAIAVFFAVWLASAYATSQRSSCAPETCGGPWRFYKDIGCKPVYKAPSDCCPMRYDCNHLKTRSKDKCHAFGKEYNVGDEVQSESGTLGCFGSCKCIKESENKVGFICAQESPPAPSISECYRPRNATECYAGPEICYDKPEEVPTCQVGDRTVKTGEYFSPEGEPRKACWCGPGYSGENVAPFCKDTTAEFCGVELYNKWEVENDCSPLYDTTQDVSLDCNYQWRCHQADDKIIPRELMLDRSDSEATPAPVDEPDMRCKLGPLILKENESLNRIIDDKCEVCICQVPPALTCVKTVKDVCNLRPEDLKLSEEKQ